MVIGACYLTAKIHALVLIEDKLETVTFLEKHAATEILLKGCEFYVGCNCRTDLMSY